MRRAPPVPRCAALCRDQSSYTRVAVLQTWEYLAEHRAVPLGHWRSVTEIAKGAAATGPGPRGVRGQLGMLEAHGKTRPQLAAYGSPCPGVCRAAVRAHFRPTRLPPSLPRGASSTPLPAAGRLEDKSSLVRKEALRLLQALMLHNPFGPKLPSDRFEASLAAHKAMLEQLLPPEAGAEDAMQEGIRVEGAEAGGAAAEGATVKAEPGAEPSAEGMDVDEGAEGEGVQDGAQQEEAAGEAGEVAPVQPVRSREWCYQVPLLLLVLNCACHVTHKSRRRLLCCCHALWHPPSCCVRPMLLCALTALQPPRWAGTAPWRSCKPWWPRWSWQWPSPRTSPSACPPSLRWGAWAGAPRSEGPGAVLPACVRR